MPKLVSIIIRGVEMKVPADIAKELQQMEKEIIRKEWNSNALGE